MDKDKIDNRISIIGCGWLGFSLAKQLIKKGFNIKGASTSEKKLQILDKESIIPFVIQLYETKIEGNITEFLDKSEILIVNIPPGLRKNPNKNHIKEIENLIEEIEKSNVKNILYISSTSVFEDQLEFPVITDSTKPNASSDSAKQLIEIENLLQKNPSFNTTILRFAGLFDEERHPGKILSGRKNISNPKAPVNLIHKNDCISIICQLIEENLWNRVFNACYPSHPTKSEYYKHYCQTQNLELPEFNTKEASKGKIIDTTTLAQLLKYEYKTGL